MSININSYIKAVPETDVDREALMLIMEQPGEQEELEEFISEIVKNNYETLMYSNYKGINLILERVTMSHSQLGHILETIIMQA